MRLRKSLWQGIGFVKATCLSALLLVLMSFPVSPGAQADSSGLDPSVSFNELCDRSFVLPPRDCRCLTRTVNQRFEGRDRELAFLYGKVAVITEEDLLALRHYVLSKKCEPIPLSDAMSELSQHHKLPVFLFRELYKLGITKEAYFAWGKEKGIADLWRSCHRPSERVRSVEEDLLTCLSTTEGLESCSRCHDGQGIDLAR